MLFVFYLYITRLYSYVICMSLVCTRMSSICHSYVFVCHPYVTRIYSYVTRISLVCTCMSAVCHSSVVVPYTVLNFCLKFIFCERIWSIGKIPNSPLPHTLTCPWTFNCWYCRCRMCSQHTLTMSFSLVFPSPVSSMYSSSHLSQMTTYMKLKLLHVKWCFSLNVT